MYTYACTDIRYRCRYRKKYSTDAETGTDTDTDTDTDIEKRPEAHVMGEEFLSLLEKCNFEAVTKLIKMNPEIVAEDMSKNTIEVRI